MNSTWIRERKKNNDDKSEKNKKKNREFGNDWLCSIGGCIALTVRNLCDNIHPRGLKRKQECLNNSTIQTEIPKSTFFLS